jgi:phage I-like protein
MLRRRPNPSIDLAIAACAFEVQTDGAIQLTPWGRFRARDGRPGGLAGWFVDETNVDKVLAALAAHKDKIVIDYEHQTLFSEKNGQPAPAAGWFSGSQVEARPGEGLFVVPEWTAAAKAAIDAKEYRYFSPVLGYSKRTGEVQDILMGAVVNYAAIDGMTDLYGVAAAKFLPHQATKEEPPMEALLKLFGLSPDATEDEAVTALKALQQKITDLEQQVTDKDQAIAAAKAETPESAMESIQGMQAEIAALKTQINGKEVDDLISVALEDGRLVPAQESWARELGKSDVAALKGYLDTATPIAALNGRQTHGKEGGLDGKQGALSETDLAVCKGMGIDPEEYKQTLEAE